MTKTAILVSGGGTNLQALIDAKNRGELPETEFVGVISSSPRAYALKRAEAAGIACFVVDIAEYPDIADRDEFTDAVVDILNSLDVDLVVTATFLYIMRPRFADEYSRRIINIHPSLLPAFGGIGCFGIHVHEKALEYGVKVTGATAHFVTQEPDVGPIILQHTVEVMPDDTPEMLQLRVMEQAEWLILPEAVALYCTGRLRTIDNVVYIIE